MTDTITMPNGTVWTPSTSTEVVHCEHCGNAVDTPEEIQSYPEGNCPDCGNNWHGAERKDTTIVVTQPQQLGGHT
tara:strand:+ start:2032 stop:2256 length:225 start_codon:yes stop_codon:yes gene_type:complete